MVTKVKSHRMLVRDCDTCCQLNTDSIHFRVQLQSDILRRGKKTKLATHTCVVSFLLHKIKVSYHVVYVLG